MPDTPTLPRLRPLAIRGVTIGGGVPKTIVPITADSAAQAVAQARAIGACAGADIAEWRIDFLDIAADADALLALAPRINEALCGKPLLLTFRTLAEGGTRAISDADYGALHVTLAAGGAADLYDVEQFRDAAVVGEIVAAVHAAGAAVVMSSHDFHATPDTTDMVARLRQQEALGADVLKLAVMPHDAGDVLRLLDATWQLRQTSDRPLLTMAMGPLGVISRLAGQTFGQALTFGMLGTASAPGQMDVDALRQVLDLLQQAAPATV